MVQISCLFVVLLNAFIVYNAIGSPIKLTNQLYREMLTKDFLNYKMASQDNLTVATELGELGQISDVEERMNVAKSKYPEAYEILQTYLDALKYHMTRMAESKAMLFYGKYIDKVVETIARSGNKNQQFTELIQYVIPKWNDLTEDEKNSFGDEFPEIAKVLNDPEVQKLGKENTNDDNAELEEAKKD